MSKVVIIFICAILLFPIYYMIQASLSPAIIGILPQKPLLFPRRVTLENYSLLLEQQDILWWIFNSIVVFAGYVGTAILVNGLAGYVFSFAKFPGKEVLFWILMASMVITRYALIIPQFVVIRTLHLKELPAVILMTSFWPAGIYLFRNYFNSIPRSLIESARIDGAGNWTIFGRVVLPLSKPILGATIVMKGIESLSDFVWQNLNLLVTRTQTLLVGLTQSVYKVRGMTGIRNLSYELVVGTVLLLPLIMIFSFSSKYFLKGVTLGAVKE